MDPEAPGLLSLLLGEGDLGVDLLAPSPSGGEALEGGAVFEAGVEQALIEAIDVDRLSALGWPGLDRLLGWWGLGADQALGVAGPLAGLFPIAALGPGVDRDLALAVFAGAGESDLQLGRALLAEDQ